MPLNSTLVGREKLLLLMIDFPIALTKKNGHLVECPTKTKFGF
jgi:hypothetical protein